MAKYKVGDVISDSIKRWAGCEIIEVGDGTYTIETDNGRFKLAMDFIDEVPKPPHCATIVAGIYRKKDGSYTGKEYFFKDRTNDGFGGLQIGDIALAYTHRSNRCLPLKITKVGISAEELEKEGIERQQLVCLRYLGDENYGRI